MTADPAGSYVRHAGSAVVTGDALHPAKDLQTADIRDRAEKLM